MTKCGSPHGANAYDCSPRGDELLKLSEQKAKSELVNLIALQINDQNDQRDAVGHIPLQSCREMNSFSCICFLQEIHPSPSVPSGTEQYIA